MLHTLDLLDTIESNVIQTDIEIPQDATMIFDGMVLLQQMEKVLLSTFGDVAEYLMKRITRSSSGTVYFVTDQYIPGSIKSFEREKRSATGTIRYKVERRDQPRTKQWSKFLRDPVNKTELIHFLLADWSHPTRYARFLVNRILYVNVESKFFKLTCTDGVVSPNTFNYCR